MELAIGIILLIVVLIGGHFWVNHMTNKTLALMQEKVRMDLEYLEYICGQRK